MMTSKADATEAFVWMWLPGAMEPVVAGRLDQDGERLLYTYGASYRRRQSAIPIYEPELPLQEGVIAPINGLSMASCIRDGSPDAWGRQGWTRARLAALTEAELAAALEAAWTIAQAKPAKRPRKRA